MKSFRIRIGLIKESLLRILKRALLYAQNRTKLNQLSYGLLAILVIAPTFFTLVTEKINNQWYTLLSSEKSLVSKSSVKSELIKTTEDAFTYNRKEELNIPNGEDPALRQLLLSASKAESTGKEPYQASISKDPTDGITFGDAEGTRKFTLTPNFGMSEARMDEDNRIVYPRSSTERSIYTFKKNGIKNDITLLEAPSADSNTNGSIKTYKYTLDLGKELDAKQLPSGDIGIYSADPKFFGNVQTTDESSKALVEKARANSPKDTLVFEIPKPFIIDSSKKINYEDVSFKLEPNKRDQTKPTLILEVRNLQNLPYPISIDPTITVTTTSDFQTNTGDTGNVDFGTSGQITRGSIGSGALGGSWASPTAFSTARGYQTTVVSNGYMYVIGGCTAGGCSTFSNDIQIGTLNSSGGVSSWSSTTFNTARISMSAFAYNNYLYIIGGQQANNDTNCNLGGGFYCSDVQYTTINPSTGALGTWQYTFNGSGCATLALCGGGFPTVITSPGLTAYNGYVYAIGGFAGSAVVSTVRYAQINANGTLSAWSTNANSIPQVRTGVAANYYNGYVYATGGTDFTNYFASVVYAPVQSDGTLGAWATSSSYNTTRAYHGGIIHKGYIYVAGGQSSSGDLSDFQYAPINADGTVGTWMNTTALTSTLRFANLNIHNGYLYVTGGNAGGAYSTYIRSAPITQGGPSINKTDDVGLAQARRGQSSVVFNNYLYSIGGVDGLANYSNGIQRCALNNDGSTQNCTEQSSIFTFARAYHSSVINGSNLYIIGGYTGVNNSDIQYCVLNTSTGAVTSCATNATGFATARNSHSSVVYNGYIYIIGGETGASSVINDIQYCPINSNGSVGACVTNATGFNTARRIHTSVVHNEYLYIIGGLDGSGSTRYSDIQSCKINSDASVSSCFTITNAMGESRYSHTSVVHQGYLYIIGGYTSVLKNDIEYCPIYDGGIIGVCSSVSNAFTTARERHSSVAHNGFLYVIGGNASGSLQDIQYIRIGPPSGGVGTTTQQLSAYNTARYNHASVSYNNYIYILGGFDNTSRRSDIQYCPINSNGSVGTCVPNATGFTAARINPTANVYNNYLYIVGGNNGANLNDIQYCPINSNGSVGACTQQNSAFTSGRYLHSSLINNGILYIIGGFNGSYLNDIQYCPINSNGSVGACTQQNSAFTSGRYNPAAVVFGNFIYIIGGADATVAYNDIQYCPINSNGSVGACTQQNSAFTSARTYHFTAVYNNTIYIVGGLGVGAVNLNDIQYCPINSNGSVGACTQQNSAFITARHLFSGAVDKGNIYVIGGYDGVSPQGDIQRVGTSLVNNYAVYERTIDTGSTSNTIGAFAILGSTKCAYSVKFATAGSSNVYSAVTSKPFVLPGTSVQVTASNARYLRLSINLDDSSCGSISSITDIAIYYNDTPSAPTLLSPATNSTAISTLPEFRLGSTDDNPYQFLRYKIEVCSTSNCSSIVRTIDQTVSQTGWLSQSQSNGTGYSTGASITQYAIHRYQSAGLSYNTQYWWRAYAIDPESSNSWSSASTISTFTTEQSPTAAPPNNTNQQVIIKGGVDMGGNVILKP